VRVSPIRPDAGSVSARPELHPLSTTNMVVFFPALRLPHRRRRRAARFWHDSQARRARWNPARAYGMRGPGSRFCWKEQRP